MTSIGTVGRCLWVLTLGIGCSSSAPSGSNSGSAGAGSGSGGSSVGGTGGSSGSKAIGGSTSTGGSTAIGGSKAIGGSAGELAGSAGELNGAGGAEPGPEPCTTGTWDDDEDPQTACADWTTCAPGEYVATTGSESEDRTCSGCPSGTFSAAENADECVAWADCEAGDYVSEAGTAAADRTCASCANGTYTSGSNQSACVPQGECAPGTQQTVAGTSTTPPTCVACADGTYCAGSAAAPVPCAADAWDHDADPATACSAKSACLAGEFVTDAGTATSDRSCDDCASETYSATQNSNACTPWTDCTAGQFVTAAGTPSTNRACSACANGSYSTATNAVSCTTWHDCGIYPVATPGTATADQACDCPDGYVDLGGCKRPESCDQLHKLDPTAASGVYTLDPDGDGSGATLQAHCDMVTEGGGWTLVLKVDGNQPTFGYSAALWTNQTLYNANAPDFDTTEAKLGTFNSVPFTALLMRMQVPVTSGAVQSLRITHSGASLYAVMGGNTYTAFNTPPSRADWKALAGPTSSLQYNCNMQGFNVEPGYSSIRIGYLGNNENDCGSPDSYIGVGGLDSPCVGGFAPTAGGSAGCNGDNGNLHFPGFVWLYVR